MIQLNSFTNYNIVDISNKSLYFFDCEKLNISNLVNPIHLSFFHTYYGDYYMEIIYFEHNIPLCPKCNVLMNKNGSRPFKLNKKDNIRKQQYICPVCGKTHCTSLENFIDKGCNYSIDICVKSLQYESIAYLSYQKKAEIIELENGTRLNRQTVYYHESKYSDVYIKEKEEKLQNELKEYKIEPSGIYHYDEEFLHVNGENIVRLTIIDAINNLIINDQFIKQEDFDKEFMEIFLKHTLEGLPKRVLITDGHPAYPSIIERICINHQLCIFHIIKIHRTSSYKKIQKLKRRIKKLEEKINKNKTTIKELKEKSKGLKGNTPKEDKNRKRRIKKRKKLEKDNKKYRKELKEKRAELNKQERTNERISNIYNTETEKAAIRRFNTIYNQLNEFDDDTQTFLKNLGKKFKETTTYLKNEAIPKTNNKIEGFFKITLPKQLKRIFRTKKGLIRWIKLQKIRWIERNVLSHKTQTLT